MSSPPRRFSTVHRRGRIEAPMPKPSSAAASWFSTVHRRGRIEANRPADVPQPSVVGSPRFTAVAELKRAEQLAQDPGHNGSPRFTAVAELKLGARHPVHRCRPRFSTVHRRGRIEASWTGSRCSCAARFSTVHRRGRIEAGARCRAPAARSRSPRFTAVAELKQLVAPAGVRGLPGFSTVHRRGRIEASACRRPPASPARGSPRFTAVAELKPDERALAPLLAEGSPRFTAVAELKRALHYGYRLGAQKVLHGSPPWPN